jgi:hypothetical protein
VELSADVVGQWQNGESATADMARGSQSVKTNRIVAHEAARNGNVAVHHPPANIKNGNAISGKLSTL